MQYFDLGVPVLASRFCFGCEPLGGSDWGDDVDVDDITHAIEVALDQGINFFDTADVYGLGMSEVRLGNILGNRRHDQVIATKGGVSWKENSNGRAITSIDSSPEYIRSAVENSLRRLRVERIPVYYIHWPEKDKDVGLAAEALYQLQSDDKIGAIGCSNFSVVQLQRALEFAPIKLLQMPVNILMDQVSPDISDLCQKNEIAVIGYNVLASGLLTGKFGANTVFTKNDRRSRLPQFVGDGLVRSIDQVEGLLGDAKRAGLSLAQYSIKCALNQPAVEATIIGIKRTKQLEENVRAFL